MVHTRTHTATAFANPFLTCFTCRQQATAFHHGDETACGCGAGNWLLPCKHNAEAVSVCPSWDPLDGCQCQEVLGRVDHPVAPAAR